MKQVQAQTWDIPKEVSEILGCVGSMCSRWIDLGVRFLTMIECVAVTLLD